MPSTHAGLARGTRASSHAAATVEDLPPVFPAPPTRVAPPTDLVLEAIDLGRRRDRRRFLDVSAPLYRGDPHYIEPLRFERMQFLDARRNPGLRDLEIRAVLAVRE